MINGQRDLDLFIQQKDGKKIVDPEKQSALCFRLKVGMLHPLRVIIANRGPDTELLVANPVELSGKGRPRVFYDITHALKALGICIFSVRNHCIRIKNSRMHIHSTCLGVFRRANYAMHRTIPMWSEIRALECFVCNLLILFPFIIDATAIINIIEQHYL